MDASIGTQLWSKYYDRNAKDIFEVQDEVVRTIIGAIEPELTVAEWERIRRKPADNLDAWDHYRRGTWHLYHFGSDDMVAAQQHCRAAIAADSDFAQPYVALAYTCHLSLIFDYAIDRAATLDEGLGAPVQLDDRDAFAHAILGRLYMMGREFDLAIAETRTAIEINPHSAQAHYGLGFALVVMGEAEKAIGPLMKAVDLSPRDPNLASYGTVLATAYILLKANDKALEWARFATRQPSSHFIAYMHLAVALAQLGDAEAARKVRDKLLQLKPDFDLEYVRRCWPFKRQIDEARLLKGLQKLGL